MLFRMATNAEIMYQALMEELRTKSNKLEADLTKANAEKANLENQVNQLNQKLAKVIGVAQPYIPKEIMLVLLNEMIGDVVNQLITNETS